MNLESRIEKLERRANPAEIEFVIVDADDLAADIELSWGELDKGEIDANSYRGRALSTLRSALCKMGVIT